jgi:hypothetical protein
MQQFLGLANYFRKFVPNFSRIADPLYPLVVPREGIMSLHVLMLWPRCVSTSKYVGGGTYV